MSCPARHEIEADLRRLVALLQCPIAPVGIGRGTVQEERGYPVAHPSGISIGVGSAIIKAVH